MHKYLSNKCVPFGQEVKHILSYSKIKESSYVQLFIHLFFSIMYFLPEISEQRLEQFFSENELNSGLIICDSLIQ